ncbi:MAG: endonuclease domain-containing protein [Anaerolineae bacterium]|nr:endonuclease domain-containing protein [Anaerolineae bacterium]
MDDWEGELRARASEAMVHIARDLRQRQTPAEVLLWEAVRDRRLDGLKFRRQHPVENTAYVVDFLCYEARLVVELDGGIHADQPDADAIRQAEIEAQGYHVLRFRNQAVQDDLESVLMAIVAAARPGSRQA